MIVDFIYTIEPKKRGSGALKKLIVIMAGLVLVLSQVFSFAGGEAHIVNVTAEICNISEIRSMGYWKNHPEVYGHYLPQSLGNESVDTAKEADEVFKAVNNVMKNKLKKQLLAMKFNIANFGIGGYSGTDTGGKTLDQIVGEADDLLRNPDAAESDYEAMKNLLDGLNNLGQIKFCGTGGYKPNIVINKVYYDVDGKHGEERGNEWIEIYNPTDASIDISGWVLEDNSTSDAIPNSAPVPAFGFAVVAGKDTTWNYWSLPSGTVKIVLPDGDIGDGLDNNGDKVTLKKANGDIADEMSYEGNTSVWNPASPLDGNGYPYDLPEGHILGRVPSGYDTDQASDFKDLGLPVVEVMIPNGGEKWWVGRTYELKWKAVNPNGLDSDLSIDIWYSRDSGGTWGKIATATENDGVFLWRVPLFIGSYYTPSEKARIKVMATGPENFMAQGWDMSDEDFCPPIDYDLLTPEELAQLEEMGLLGVIGGATADSTLPSDSASTTDPVPTSTIEIISPSPNATSEVAYDAAGTASGTEETASTTDELSLPEEDASATVEIIETSSSTDEDASSSPPQGENENENATTTDESLDVPEESAPSAVESAGDIFEIPASSDGTENREQAEENDGQEPLREGQPAEEQPQTPNNETDNQTNPENNGDSTL